MPTQNIGVRLYAVIVTVRGGNAEVLTMPDLSLPNGPLIQGHKSFEEGLRSWLNLPLGYVEQLYTFGNFAKRTQSIDLSYLALARAEEAPKGYQWSSWYDHLPWEDYRTGAPSLILNSILPALSEWKNAAKSIKEKQIRGREIDKLFPREERRWNEELAPQRYELLLRAGLLTECINDGIRSKINFGLAMPGYGRKILAMAIYRLRAKVKYRPVIFELMQETFTLFRLQRVVESIAGLRLHKQNFRRTIIDQDLVEGTKGIQRERGRPAKLFVYRPEVLEERFLAGTKFTR